MLVIRTLDSANGLEIGECRSQMGNPLPHPARVALLQICNHPREIRSVWFEAADLAGRACLPDQQTIQDDLLHPSPEKTLEPRRNWKLRFVFGEVSKGALPRAELERVVPSLARLVIEVVIAVEHFIDYRLGALYRLGRKDRVWWR